MMYYLIPFTVLLSAINACNYIAINNQAIQLDACHKVSNVITNGTRHITSRTYECILNETSGNLAQFLWWSDSESCGAEEGSDPSYDRDIYDCDPDGDIPCNCEASSSDCNIATKITYGGKPGACDESQYETEQIVLDVCIPGDSETIVSSRIIECADGGSKIKNKVFETEDCTGDYSYNYDDIDSDTCYEITCDSFAAKISLNITSIIMVLFVAAKLL
mmetsp:Transcript_6196/g.5430  ORF Transcript_6196/g.5430 Transcript_6196/m.5430 type:complete len:219 (-) Transcript_6196:470-1126(-)